MAVPVDVIVTDACPIIVESVFASFPMGLR